MVTFDVHVDTSSPRFEAEVRAGGNILVDFHLVVDGREFPSSPWLDFPVIVLAWWLEGVQALLADPGRSENSFMNGPYEFVATRDGEEVELTFYRRTVAEPVQEGTPLRISFPAYRDALLSAAERLVASLDRLGASGSDLEALRHAHRAVAPPGTVRSGGE